MANGPNGHALQAPNVSTVPDEDLADTITLVATKDWSCRISMVVTMKEIPADPGAVGRSMPLLDASHATA
jgi:hypothetical protein